MIVPLTPQLAQAVAGSLRDRDRREVEALMPVGMTVATWATSVLTTGGEHWCAIVGDVPVAMGGVRMVPGLPHLAVTWAVGTDRKTEAGTSIMACAMRLHKDWERRGVRKFQCYCLDTPEESSEWLERLGYRLEGQLRGFGINGEHFLLWGTHGR